MRRLLTLPYLNQGGGKSYPYLFTTCRLLTLLYLNPILDGVWNIRCWTGGAIMARIDFRPYKCTKLPLGAQNWFPNKYFDLWLSIDTKNSLFITGLP